MPNFISEDDIEQAMVQKLQLLHGYDSLNCFTSDPEDLDDDSGRTDKRDVILRDRLLGAAIALNPDIPEDTVAGAVDRLMDRRQAMSLIDANRELDGLIRDGVKVEFQNANGQTQHGRVRVIDFEQPKSPHNQFLAVTQLWIKTTGPAAKAAYRRPDVILYVNGLPLVLIELKNSNVKVRTAFDDNLTTYKAEIPQLFLPNAMCVLSNGLDTRVGSLTAEWEHFFPWLRPDDEKENVKRKQVEEDGTSVERFLAGLCPQDRLLDYCENFVVYYQASQKIVAQNHQFLGVNRAYRVFLERRAHLDWSVQSEDLAKKPLTPTLSQKERELQVAAKKGPHYRGGFDFSGLLERARELRQQQTPAEEVLWAVLRNRRFLGLKFRRQHQVGDYIPDFYCDEHKLIVEADGSVHATPENAKKDAKRDSALEAQGFRIVRLPNEVILEDLKTALTRIANALPSTSGRGVGGEGKTPRIANGLGVFWHTQGSGKSFSMIFYARKIYRKCQGNYTFVVVTDREDLDGQIYKNFLRTETVTKAEAAQPKNSEQLRTFLGQNKRIVFTLIHKFRWPKGKAYPLLSDRDDIVVVVDEAHRTQYKSLAENMRAGLPKAQYLAFTGTPLLGRDRKTNEWFGDYVSEYGFTQSVDDGATVPLYYSKRVPRMQNQNEDLSEEFYEILEDENLDEAQQEKLERKFATELSVIRRPDRIAVIADEIVQHFPRRGYLGKGLVVTLDKPMAVTLFGEVQRRWKEAIKELRGQIKHAAGEGEKRRLKRRLGYMRRVEMAVVVSEEENEAKKFDKKGLDIRPHRARMNALDANGHDIEDNFKDPGHPLQLVFVCAMWLTGFDAPTVSTLYLDKPQKDHTLMQTIARANRVSPYKIGGVEKLNGEIVDFFGVLPRLKKAVKDYGQGSVGADEPPVKDKAELEKLLAEAIAQGQRFCSEKGVHLNKALESEDTFKNLQLFQEWANTLLHKDEWRKGFAVLDNIITALFEASKPEVLGKPVVRSIAVFQYLRGIIDGIVQQKGVDAAAAKVDELLDESLVVDQSAQLQAKEPEGWKIQQTGHTWDLSRIDFEKLQSEFKKSDYKNIKITDLRAFLEKKLVQMLKQNRTRRDFAERLQDIIDNYNAGSSSADRDFDELLKFAQALREEEDRHVREGLSADELEIYDLLKKDPMTQAEEKRVKLAARELLKRLTGVAPRVLVQDWYKDHQTRLAVRDTVGAILDEHLPEKSYDKALFTEKRDRVFDLALDLAINHQKWAA